jgi:hypothetical protein
VHKWVLHALHRGEKTSEAIGKATVARCLTRVEHAALKVGSSSSGNLDPIAPTTN